MNHPARPVPAHAHDLGEALAEAFRLLARGVADRRSAFHAPTLATRGPDGAPRLRTVVLRGVDAPARTLRVHTDARAAKAAELAADPRAALHVYDAGAALQVRVSGTATLHRLADGAPLARAAWDASRPSSRATYAVAPAPGTPVEAPSPAPSDPDAGREHFAVVVLRAESLEWLWLWSGGHRRARFAFGPGGAVEEATWLVP